MARSKDPLLLPARASARPSLSRAAPLRQRRPMSRPGETTALSPIAVPAPAVGTSVIAGTVQGGNASTRVVLLADGFERAGVNADARGRYEIEKVPAGQYLLQVSTPGYARDSRPLSLGENTRTTQDLRQLYI